VLLPGRPPGTPVSCTIYADCPPYTMNMPGACDTGPDTSTVGCSATGVRSGARRERGGGVRPLSGGGARGVPRDAVSLRMRLTVRWIWLGWVVFFFAWLFVLHGAGAVLHEVGGHGLAATILACGIDRTNLTYFGFSFVHFALCPLLSETTRLMIDWAGLAVTLSAGAVAMAFQRRAGLTPLTRLLLALLATRFLLGQLGYATSGGYYEVRDPARAAVILESHGLHVLAWLPPLVLYAAAGLYGARAIVDAFREHFGSRTRLHMLSQIAATLGAAELLHFVANRIESAIRPDTLPSIEVAAEHRAVELQVAPWFPVHRFPIHLVLIAIAVAAFVVALVRPVRRREGAETEDAAPGRIPRRHAVGVAVAALVCAITITVLVRI
jgi:hypothetical protein